MISRYISQVVILTMLALAIIFPTDAHYVMTVKITVIVLLVLIFAASMDIMYVIWQAMTTQQPNPRLDHTLSRTDVVLNIIFLAGFLGQLYFVDFTLFIVAIPNIFVVKMVKRMGMAMNASLRIHNA